MRRIDDIKLLGAFTKNSKGGTVTGFSQVYDTLGCEDVLFTIATGSIATNTDTKFYFYHASASTASAGNATAFGTVPTLTTAATASQRHAVLIEGQVGRKRYLVVKMSKLKVSHGISFQAMGLNNRSIPASSTHGSFTSVIRPLV